MDKHTKPEQAAELSQSVSSKLLDTRRGERPFNAYQHEVKAILAGKQTQFRRVLKRQPPCGWNPHLGFYHPTKINRNGEFYPGKEIYGAADENFGIKCPYGKPGERLWVRETWAEDDRDRVFYKSDCIEGTLENCTISHIPGIVRWESPIIMPRKYSRITLEITEVKVERIQDPWEWIVTFKRV